MRRTPIRVKLGVALAVPLLGLFLITVIEVAGTAGDVAEVRRQTALARASIGPSGLITSLQNERTWAVTELIGQETAIQPPIVGYDASRAATDQAISAFRDTLDDTTSDTVDAYEPALATLGGLNDLRARIDESTATRDLTNVEFSDEIFGSYLHHRTYEEPVSSTDVEGLLDQYFEFFSALIWGGAKARCCPRPCE